MQLFRTWLNKAVSELDRTMAILGLLFASMLTIWVVTAVESLMWKVAAGLAVFACAGYLVLRKRLPPYASFSSAEPSSRPRLRMILNILFFLLLSASVLLLYLRPELYVRPVSYFIVIALMVATLALEILLLPHSQGWTYLILFKVMVVGLSLEWSQLLLFPGVVGVDPWVHQRFTVALLESGHVPGYSSYAKMPFMHLTMGATSLVTGLNYKMASMLSLGLLQVVSSTLFVFLLGRFLYSDRAGLVSALFLSVGNEQVHFGIWLIPMTAGALWLLPVIYLLFKTKREKPATAFLLALLLMLSINLTHSIAAVAMALLFLIFLAGFAVHQRMSGEKLNFPVTLTITILFGIGMLSYWMYASEAYFRTAVGLFKWGFSEEFWGTPAAATSVEYMPLHVPASEWMFGTLGIVLFFTVALFGCFYMTGRRFGNAYTFVLAIGGVILLALGYLAPVVDIWIIEERWRYFAQIMMAIPFGVAVLLLFGEMVRKKYVQLSLIVAFSFGVTFLMVMSPDVNMDNRVFTPNTAIRFAFTESEQQAADTLVTLWAGDIGTDLRYGVVGIRRQMDIDMSLYSGDYSQYQGELVIIREEISRYVFGIKRGAIKMNYNPYQALEEQGFARIYDCGSVSGFIKPWK